MHEDDGAPSELNLQMMRLQMALFEPSNLEQARAKVQDRVVNEDILEPEPQLESTIEHARRVVAADRNRDLDAALHFPQEPTSSQVATSERAREQRLTKQESKQAHQAMVGLHAGLRRAHYSVPDTHEREQMGSVLRAMETRDWSSVLLPCARCGQGLGAEHFCPVQNSYVDTLEDNSAAQQHNGWCISCLAAHYGKVGCSGCSGFLSPSDFSAEQMQRGPNKLCKQCQ